MYKNLTPVFANCKVFMADRSQGRLDILSNQRVSLLFCSLSTISKQVFGERRKSKAWIGLPWLSSYYKMKNLSTVSP